MMTRSLVNDDVSMMTSWNGRAAHADTLGLGELARNPAPLSRNPSPSSNPNPNSNPSP